MEEVNDLNLEACLAIVVYFMAVAFNYFDFIKFQRENLKEKISHYVKSYEMDKSASIAEFLHELEFGK